MRNLMKNEIFFIALQKKKNFRIFVLLSRMY